MMKGKASAFLAAATIVGFLFVLSSVSAVRADVTLEVFNPQGEVAPKPILAPCPRIPDLAGKKVGVYWNNKAGGDHFWDVVEAEMKQKAPSVKIVRFSGPIEASDAQIAAMSKEVDALFYGVGD
ncbi:MAG: hypothetical protein ABSD38_20255 [Syntrophorhabdales bacterium]|jgi:hypothetical protein